MAWQTAVVASDHTVSSKVCYSLFPTGVGEAERVSGSWFSRVSRDRGAAAAAGTWALCC